jgi:iron(III) transport system substrate-binding protein
MSHEQGVQVEGVTGQTLSRRRLLRLAGAGGVGLLGLGLAACSSSTTPAAAPSTPNPPPAGAAQPTAGVAAAQPTTAAAAQPTAAQPTAAAASAAQSAPAQAAAGASWTQLVDAAVKEGKVVVSGPPTDDARKNIPEAFKQRFGIDVEYLGGNSSQLASRIQSERAAGQYTIDVSMGGADTFYRTFLDNGWLEPIKPVLTLPEVVDPSAWIMGSPWFRDPKNHDTVLSLFNTISPIGYYNTALINSDQLRNADLLLDPSLKGKIGAYNPAVNGGGVLAVSGMYVAKGPQFLIDLFTKQEIATTRDYQQLADWVGHGNYPLCMGMLVHDAELLKADLPLQQTSFPDVQETTSGGFGLIGLWTQAPHPNAAKVYVNWIASKEAAIIYGKADGSASVRTDVDSTAWIPANLIPKKDGSYIDSYDYTFVTETRATIQKVMAPIVGGAA